MSIGVAVQTVPRSVLVSISARGTDRKLCQSQREQSGASWCHYCRLGRRRGTEVNRDGIEYRSGGRRVVPLAPMSRSPHHAVALTNSSVRPDARLCRCGGGRVGLADDGRLWGQ
jgi:hypothetical protein